MTERKRLIDLLSQKIYPIEGADPAEVVANYLLANGVIVLPCRKGDFLNYKGKKYEANHWNILLTAYTDDETAKSNETIYLFTIEEAEEALKEREEK